MQQTFSLKRIKREEHSEIMNCKKERIYMKVPMILPPYKPTENPWQSFNRRNPLIVFSSKATICTW